MQNFGINVQLFKPKTALVVVFWVLAVLCVLGGFVYWVTNYDVVGSGTAFLEDCIAAVLFVALGSVIECLRDIRFLLALQTCGNIKTINIDTGANTSIGVLPPDAVPTDK